MISADTHEKTILVIDDSVINLKFLNVILAREGFEVLSTSNSLDAVPLALQNSPDLILLDVMMNGINGIDVLKLLKQNSLTKDIPVVMVTARTHGSDVRLALENGAFDYVKKPLDEIEIIARVRSSLRYKAYQDRLVEMAMRDSLTGLYNHALLIDLLDKEIYNAKRKDLPLAFAMVDIDHFKTVNDLYGHLAGDQVLKEVGGLLTLGLRKGDPVGRYGGEEFGVILHGASLDQASMLCERLRTSVMDTDFSHDAHQFKVTVSVGLAGALPASNASPNELVRRADEALYRAKEDGRNRLVVA